jgi:hypothetical protein
MRKSLATYENGPESIALFSRRSLSDISLRRKIGVPGALKTLIRKTSTILSSRGIGI